MQLACEVENGLDGYGSDKIDDEPALKVLECDDSCSVGGWYAYDQNPRHLDR